jgi:hypothetical protein
MADDKVIAAARLAFDLAAEAEAENRREALDDLRFARLGEQWPEKVRRERELEGRPCLTINRLPAFIRQVVNDARQNKPAIVVHPVDDSSDPETSEVFNGLIRNVEQSSDAEVAYDTALDFAVTSGVGYFRINTAYSSEDTFDQDLVIERMANPFAVYGDPDSVAADSSDWNVAFILDDMSRQAFEARWPKAEPVSWAGGEDFLEAADGGGDRVTVAEYWTREVVERAIVQLSDGEDPGTREALDAQVVDLAAYREHKPWFDMAGMQVVGEPRTVRTHKVTQRLLSGAEVLETVEWAGKYIPIVPVYGEELLVDGRRVLRSLVRDAKDPQRMFNYWRTTSTELVALAPKTPYVGPKGAFDTDADKWESANVKSHAYIEYDGTTPPQRQSFTGTPPGALQEALNAADDMKSIMGLYDASLGAKSNETSGRAIMARQREGDVSTFHYIDNLSRAIRHAGRILIDLIPKVYSVARVVRVLGPDGKAKTVPVNQPHMAEVKGENGQMTRAHRIFDLTKGKYDLTVKAGPSFTSQREEAANQMIELIRAFPAAAPVIGDMLARNLDWPGADEISARLQALLPPPVQALLGKGGPASLSPEVQQGIQQQGQQLQQLGQALAAARQEIAKLQGDRSMDARKLEIDAFEAETRRMAALARTAPIQPQSRAVTPDQW